MPALLVCAATFATSCDETLEIGKDINDSNYADIYQNDAYLRDGKSGEASTVVELYNNNYQTTVQLGLSKASAKGSAATISIDPAYLETYNKEHETDFEIFPQDQVSIDNDGALTIDAGGKTAYDNITIEAGTTLKEDKTYAIPLTISDPSGDLNIKNETDRHCVYLVKDMRGASDAYKGENAVKGFLYFEVNGVNPLNALAFQLENGKVLWDAVVLFAANINYSAADGRPYVACNPQVQYLLDNSETLLQPLRRRGVKVLLGLLGNHDMTGLAQLSKQGAKDFARELGQYVKAYNLDGVNFDDEYSESPDLNNPALTSKGSAAAARLCYETKQMMPDKMVTVFAYGSMWGTSSVDGVDANEWCDAVVPNYGGTAYPLGQMGKDKCAGAAYEFARNLGSPLTASKAQSLISGGYGWFMGFAPSPEKFVSQFGKLTGAETLYGSPLKAPFIYYKWNDPTPYPYPDKW